MAGPTSRSILISGAGIAGPTLAYWLLKRGFQPVLLERAPRFREGGYVIDFWGVGIDVAERMELLPRLRDIGYLNDRITFVGPNGRVRSTFGGAPLRRALGDRFVTIQREISLMPSTKRSRARSRPSSATASRRSSNGPTAST